MKKLLGIVVLGFVWSNLTLAKEFNISDLDKIGFNKEDQQLFQMIGAIDGWGGTIDNEVVEAYIYKNSEAIPRDLFKNILNGDNISGWKNYCFKENIALITKGNLACEKLKKLK